MASLQFQMNDAHDCMRLAITDNRWADVAKYATQLDSLKSRLASDHSALYTIAPSGGTMTCEAL